MNHVCLLHDQLIDMERRKDGAYAERDQCVAALAKLAASLGYGVGWLPHEGPDWGPQWKKVVVIELSTGQVSWHVPEDRWHLFSWLPKHDRPWDGHSTEEKYARLNNAKHP